MRKPLDDFYTHPAMALSLGKAVDALVALDASQSAAELAAVESVRVRYAEKKAAIYARVPEHLVGPVEIAVSAAAKAQSVSEAIEQSKPFLAEVDRAFNGDDDTPSRPALEEYDAHGVMEPLSPARLEIARKR